MYLTGFLHANPDENIPTAFVKRKRKLLVLERSFHANLYECIIVVLAEPYVTYTRQIV